MTTEAIKDAQAELEAKTEAVCRAEKALEAAKQEARTAREKLHAARLERDKALPSAIVRKKEYRWSGRSDEAPVVIVRRTAKTVFVRRTGDENETGDQYRLDKCGRFWAYPSPESWEPSRELILED